MYGRVFITLKLLIIKNICKNDSFFFVIKKFTYLIIILFFIQILNFYLITQIFNDTYLNTTPFFS